MGNYLNDSFGLSQGAPIAERLVIQINERVCPH